MNLVQHGQLDPTVLATHRFGLSDTMAAYDAFADAANTGVLKVVQGSSVAPAEPAAQVPDVAGA